MKKIALIIGLFACIVSSTSAQTALQAPVKIQENELRILTWNIQMLPRMIKRTRRGPMKRARIIPQQIINDSIDIVVFEEAFDVRARRILKRKMKEVYPYRVGPANVKPFRLKTNSGIIIYSKLPLTKLGSIKFRDCNTSDCYAFKGAVLVEAQHNGVTFQVMGTHLQAWPQYDTTRVKQYVQIRDELLLPNTKPNVPQFLCGDFNIMKRTEWYNGLVDSLGAENGRLFCDQKYTYDCTVNDLADEGEPELIDYILYKGNGKQYYSMYRSITQYQQRWSPKYQDLSDHNGVLIRVVFTKVSEGEPVE